MRALFAIAALVFAGCGGLDNAPLTLGVLRGTILNPTAESLVIVEQNQSLRAKPGADGRFEIVGVPRGELTLLVLATQLNAERIPVRLEGGDVAELGSVGQKPGAPVEIDVVVPSFQTRTNTSITVGGIPMSHKVNHEGEAVIALPTGCYQVGVTLPGLGTVEKEVCVEAPKFREVDFVFEAPNGTPGREGCSVTGCDFGLVCQSSGACGF